MCVQCFPQITKLLLQSKINGWRDNYIGGGGGGGGGVGVVYICTSPTLSLANCEISCCSSFTWSLTGQTHAPAPSAEAQGDWGGVRGGREGGREEGRRGGAGLEGGDGREGGEGRGECVWVNALI